MSPWRDFCERREIFEDLHHIILVFIKFIQKSANLKPAYLLYYSAVDIDIDVTNEVIEERMLRCKR